MEMYVWVIWYYKEAMKSRWKLLVRGEGKGHCPNNGDSTGKETLNPKPYLEGQGDLVSRLITPTTHIKPNYLHY